ncbi:MAG: transcription termination factor Rho [Lachnospiraceae bacterium]|nr:transcription termination factor Rho [Lachnospiraceae bacterium]
MREKYESLSLVTLKELAKARGMKGVSAMKKSNLIELMLEQDEKDARGPKDAGSVSEGQVQNSGMKAESREAETPAVSQTMQQDYSRMGNHVAETSASYGRQNDAQGQNYERKNAGAQGENSQNRGQADGNRVRTGNGYRSNEYQQRQTGYGQDGERSGSNSRSDTGRQSGIVRTPRENGQIRMRRDNSYNYVRRDNNGSTRREGTGSNGFSAEKKELASSAVETRETAAYSSNVDAESRESVPVQREQMVSGQESAPAIERLTDADKPPMELAQLDSGISVGGILEVMPDGYGFIRSDNYLPGENDVYVSPSQIRKFNLKTGDIITGNTRIKSQQEKFSALLYLKTINGRNPSEAQKRYNFEDMTPIFPNERMRMERGSRAIAMRIVDLFSPIGKGQRGMIVSPPKAGKTTLLKDVAKSILQNDPNMRLLILLIDERPEEVTDIKEAIQGANVEVIYSTFDELPEHHKRVSEMVIERAKRLVEHKENVTILLDSITRLARAYNLTVPPSGRTLSGGLDPAALHMPKRFFGAARNMREGGSLTILATALVDTGSKMDDVVYEEFKGTGNMELVLDRKLSEKRVFPAIDIPKSGTRREDLLLDREEQEAMEIMRRALNGMKSDEAVENILNMFVHTRDNRELVQRVRRQKFI